MSEQIQLPLPTDQYPTFMPSLQDRLRAIRDDRNAKFLPTTHNEKNTALVLLDYLDWGDSEEASLREPDPLNRPGQGSGPLPYAALQLREIFFHQVGLHTKKVVKEDPVSEYYKARKHGESEGRRAVRSKAIEMSDFMINAVSQGRALRQLETDFKELVNPKVSLFEDLDPDHPGIAPLFRFFDQDSIRRLGLKAWPGTFDPFRTVEHGRSELEQDETTARNKYLHDVYTAPVRPPLVEARINYLGEVMTVGAVRASTYPRNKNMLEAALEDQRSRVFFWSARLREVAAYTFVKPLIKEIFAETDVAPPLPVK